MSPIQKEMEQDGYSTDSDIFMENLTVKWLKHLEEDGDEPTKGNSKILAKWYKPINPNNGKTQRQKYRKGQLNQRLSIRGRDKLAKILITPLGKESKGQRISKVIIDFPNQIKSIKHHLLPQP